MFKEDARLLLLLGLLTFGMFASASNLYRFYAKATYVEGPITEDTIWTLVDSPFIVSKNVTVYTDAILILEPGVDVRFGGYFSIVIYGKLHAVGTPDKEITFTSNSFEPTPADWNTIEFKGNNTSTLEFCSLEFGETAVRTVGSKLNLGDCIFSNNQNGISASDSQVSIDSCIISSCTDGNGIFVSGASQVSIVNCTLSSNYNGVALAESCSGVDIIQNTISSNTGNGISFACDSYSEITILYNVLSGNNRGLFVSGEASIDLTNNSFSHNTVGVLCDGPEGNTFHFNDFYGNDVGMDVYNGTIDATYNYWGDESGPFHTHLNPFGKGDPVGGDGVNLDFLFYLSSSAVGHTNERPIASLVCDKTLVRPNQPVMFIATNSSDDGRVDQYFFEFGDGEDSGWTTLSTLMHNYSTTGTYEAKVTVKDDFGVNSTNPSSISIGVQNLNPLVVSLSPSKLTLDYGEQISVSLHVTDGVNPIENASVSLFAINDGFFLPSSGLTDSNGDFNTFFTAPDTIKITNIRLIAGVSKTGYADGSDYEYLTVIPPLVVQISADPVKSQETSSVLVQVFYNEQPITDALVRVVSDGGGNFSSETQLSDAQGEAEFIFTAPETLELLVVGLTATATKSGYLDGQDQMSLVVEPKTLIVQILTEVDAIVSEEKIDVIVSVEYESDPVQDAMVVISSDYGGIFSPENGTTSPNGELLFTFTAPPITSPLTINITATGAKAGFVTGEDQIQISASPATLDIEITIDEALESGTPAVINIVLTSDGEPVEGVLVELWSDSGGTFSEDSQITDQQGNCTFIFTTPEVQSTLNANITAIITKEGYVLAPNATNTAMITIYPPAIPESGSALPILLILIVAIVIGLVVFLILWKLKIINITRREEDEE